VAGEETTEAHIAEQETHVIAPEATTAVEAVEAGDSTGPLALEAGATGGATQRATLTTSSSLPLYILYKNAL
jgi:hypothetical protein